jgi:hypothetical protein
MGRGSGKERPSTRVLQRDPPRGEPTPRPSPADGSDPRGPGWVLLHYQMPSTPSAARVHVWRKLKSLGAALLHDSVWVLPDNPWTSEQLEWIAAGVLEAHGDALVWRAAPLRGSDDARLVQHFLDMSTREYESLLDDLRENPPALEHAARRYQQIRRRDYFDAPLGTVVYQTLRTWRGS